MAIYTRPKLDVTGCDIPNLGFSEAEKAIMDLVGSEDGAFVNPIEDAMTGVQGAIGDTLSQINTGLGVTFTDENGNTILDDDGNPLTTFGFLADQLEKTNAEVDGFRIHSDRLSGVSVSKAFGADSPYGPGGIQGEYPGLAGLQAIASQYNTLKESLRDPAAAAEEHYSPIFNSLFGPGNDLVRSTQSLVEGDVANFLTNFPTGGDDSLSELSRLGSALGDLQASYTSLIRDDNLQYEFALDYVSKKLTGFSVLSMLEQPCFGSELLSRIGSPDLKGLAGL
tara:strand:- start:546 stop:1388 length:843 start_codon:yes stop_codon:yes gene_type:complete